MYDLEHFYEGDTVKDRPSEYRLQQAIVDVSNNIKTIDEAAYCMYDTRMWQWFDVYRQWVKGDQLNSMLALPLESDEAAEITSHFRSVFKADRETTVATSTVTVDGMIFDADENSQQRLVVAILSAIDDEETTVWVLHDNSVVYLNRPQLKQALRACTLQMSSIWVQE